MKLLSAALACSAFAFGAVTGAHPVQAQGTQFPDVPQNHWAYQAVQDLASKGYVQGYPNGKFLGNRALTRYEFATVIDRIVKTVDGLSSQVGALQTPTGTPVTQNDLNKIQALVDTFQPQLDAIQARIGGIDTQLNALRDEVSATKATANKALRTANAAYSSNPKSKFAINGYVQARYEAATNDSSTLYPRGTPMNNSAYNGTYDLNSNSQTFTVRRARVNFSGVLTNNTSYGVQVDVSGATGIGAQQVTLRDAFVAYTFGDGSQAAYPTLTAGQFFNPFGYELPLSSAAIVSPERPLAFSEDGDGIWANEDYVKGVQLSYNTEHKFFFLPSGINLSASEVNPNGRNADNSTRHIDGIYKVAYVTPNKQVGLGVSYYDGEETNGGGGVITAPSVFRDAKKQLYDVNAQYQSPKGLFVDGEYEAGKFEQRQYFTQSATTGLYSLTTDPYVKGNQISGYYVQGGWTFHQNGNHPLTLAAEYDTLFRSHSAQNNAGNIYGSGGYSPGGGSYDDVNFGYGVLYNLDKATRLRLWYERPMQVAHAAGISAPPLAGLFTSELQVKF